MRRARWKECELWLRSVAFTWESGDCLLYPFAIGSHGYGQARVNGINQLAHRFVCIEAHGEPPTVLHQAAHSCGDKTCVNKHHLRWATRSQNELDKLLHGTRLRGSSHNMAKLTELQVLAIRSCEGSQKEIASRYGVTQQTVSDIKVGRRWGWL